MIGGGSNLSIAGPWRSTNNNAWRLLAHSRFLALLSVSLHAEKPFKPSAEVRRKVLLATASIFKVFPWCSLPCNFKYLNSLTATLTDSPRSLANFLTSRSPNRTSFVLSMSEVLIHKLHRVCQLNIRETSGEIINHSLVNLEITYLNSCELCPFELAVGYTVFDFLPPATAFNKWQQPLFLNVNHLMSR